MLLVAVDLFDILPRTVEQRVVILIGIEVRALNLRFRLAFA